MNAKENKGTWIPPEKRDSAWYLFYRKFMCRVSYIQSMSVEYLQKFGMPSSGDVGYDRETANELVIRMLTINEMVDFYKNGVTVHVVNFKDTKEIYEHISDHLNAWKLQLQDSYHVRNAPIDDLLLLDKFASVVYKHAAPLFTTNMVDSLLARKASTTFKVSRENILKPKEMITINATENEEKEQVSKYPARESMAEDFVRTKPRLGSSERWK